MSAACCWRGPAIGERRSHCASAWERRAAGSCARCLREGWCSASWRALAFAAPASLAAAVLFALAPAMESFQLDLIATLRATGRGWMGRFHRRAGAVLVVGEIALGFVLV